MLALTPGVPTTGTPGVSASITYSVENQGDATAAGPWYDSLYLSTDATLDPSDVLIGRVHHLGNVAGHTSYTETLTTPLPAVAPGTYHVIVVADSRGLVPDVNRANN